MRKVSSAGAWNVSLGEGHSLLNLPIYLNNFAARELPFFPCNNSPAIGSFAFSMCCQVDQEHLHPQVSQGRANALRQIVNGHRAYLPSLKDRSQDVRI